MSAQAGIDRAFDRAGMTTERSQVEWNDYVGHPHRRQGEGKGRTPPPFTLPVHSSKASESLDMAWISPRLSAFGLPNVYRGGARRGLALQTRRSEARVDGKPSGSPTRRSGGHVLRGRALGEILTRGKFLKASAVVGVTPRTNFVHTPRATLQENRPARLEACHA